MAVAVGVGLFEFPFSSAREFWRWIDLCDVGGVDSLWQSDRLIGAQPMLECMSTMAALAGATRQLKFGMNVASVCLRDPVLLAKQCATIDYLSDGRLLPAFGIGSPHSPDWAATGTPTEGRGRRTDEALDIIARLWRGEHVTYDGEFFTLRDAVIAPLPARAKLPLWIGGSSRAAIRRTGRIGTGWIGGRETPAEAAQVVAGVREAAREYGRRVPEDHYGASFYYRFGRDDALIEQLVARIRGRFPDRDPHASIVAGDKHDVMTRIHEFVDVGVTKFVLRPIGRCDDDLYAQTQRLIEDILPLVADMDA